MPTTSTDVTLANQAGRRLLLVVDDELVNREILRNVLQDTYELAFAQDGQQALDIAHERADDLSLVLLDLMMPVMDGTETLRRLRASSDPELATVPVIVTTSDQDAEVECLRLGANDFIAKPYPLAGVILARVQRAIELREDRLIISSTERDELTGLYNRQYFYAHAERFDRRHRGLPMDAVLVDIDHFRHVNERFGSAYGDEVLRFVGAALKEEFGPCGGMVCRREADTFLVWCPHRDDYPEVLERVSSRLTDQAAAAGHTWLRMGVYSNADKSLEMERRFDRAHMAADSVRGSYAKRVGIYDASLHERELYDEQLVDDFAAALEERQFTVVYQPKYDIQADPPRLVSAEALVRWSHPRLGMVSPGAFVPLFETNGLIQQLDTYVWRETAAQIALIGRD